LQRSFPQRKLENQVMRGVQMIRKTETRVTSEAKALWARRRLTANTFFAELQKVLATYK
jgi:hypothetical protein